MKLICNKKSKDCNACPHSIPHEHSNECKDDCPDVKDCKCVPEISYIRKEKLKDIAHNETRLFLLYKKF